MARWKNDSERGDPGALLSQVEYPITPEELALAAAEAEMERDAINFHRSLPNRIYQSPADVMRELSEAEARFAMGTSDVRHRGNLGREAVETGANATRHQ